MPFVALDEDIKFHDHIGAGRIYAKSGTYHFGSATVVVTCQ